MKAAIYARVSTANNGQDPRVQTRELGEFCERRGWTLVEYVDVGISGTKEKRPALDRLMSGAGESRTSERTRERKAARTSARGRGRRQDGQVTRERAWLEEDCARAGSWSRYGAPRRPGSRAARFG